MKNNLLPGFESELKWIDENPQYYKNHEHQELVKTNIAIRYKCVKMMSDLDRVLNNIKENKGE